MPDPYVNPSRVPYVGGYQWIPPTPKTLGNPINFLDGFDALIIDRGKYINYYAPYGEDPTIVSTGSSEGDKYSPILNSFRPLQNQSIHIPASTTSYYQLSGNFIYSCIFSNYLPFSGTEIEYDFSIWLFDTNLEKDYNYNYLTPDQINTFATKLAAARSLVQKGGGNVIVDLSFIDLNRLMLGQTIATNSSNTTFEFPSLINNLPISFPVTRVRVLETEGFLTDPNQIANINFVKKFIKLVDERTDISKFQNLKQIDVKSRIGVTSTSLIFNLKSIKFYQASRCNFYTTPLAPSISGVTTNVSNPTPNDQLPCQAMSYSFLINGTYDGGVGGFYWPQVNDHTTPNFHFKVYNPEYASNSPGFAHSLSIYVFVVSWNFYDPLANFFGFSGPLYVGVIVGLTLTVRKNTFYLNPELATVNGASINNKLGRNAMLITPYVNSLPNNIKSAQAYYSDQTQSAEFPYSLAGSALNVDPKILPSNKYEVTISGTYHTSIGNSSIDNNIKFITIYTTKEGGLVSDYTTYPPIYLPVLQPMQALVDSDLLQATQNSQLLYRYCDVLTSETIGSLLELNPVAIFVQESDRPFANPIIIESGVWQTKLNCAAIDSLELFDSKFFFRWWFVPETYAFDSYGTLKQWQLQNEIYFNTQFVGSNPITIVTNIAQGTPQSFDHLMISSALSSTTQNYIYSKYINSGLDFQASAIGTDRLKLVVALYAYSVKKYPPQPGQENSFANSTYYPIFQCTLSPSTTEIDTTISQVLSQAALLPFREYTFTSVNEYPYNQNVSVLNLYVNGSVLDSSLAYPVYNNKLSQSSTAASNLLSIATLSGQPSNVKIGQFIIPLSDISDFRNTTTSQYVDFITNATNFYNSRVEAGNWQIVVTTNYPALEKTLITYEIRLDGFFADNNGVIVARVLRTAFTQSSTGVYNYVIPITVPFAVPNTDCQFVLRLTYISYSASKTTVDLNALNKQLSPLSAGLKINSITIVSDTLQTIIVNQNDNAGGTQSFYEDLPLVGTLLDDPSFIFYLNPDILSPQVIFNASGLLISGVLYSPTYAVDFPSNMEVVSHNALLCNYIDNIGVRAAKSQSTKSLSSTQDNFKKQTLVVSNVSSLNQTNNNNLNLITSDFSQRLSNTSQVAQGTTANGNMNLNGSNPIVLPFKSFFLGYQADVTGGTTFNLQHGDVNYNQFSGSALPTYTRYANVPDGYILNTINIDAVYDRQFNVMHLIGIASNNFLIHKPIKDTDISTYPSNTSGPIYVIEGAASGTLVPSPGEVIVYPRSTADHGLIGILDGKFASIIIDKYNVFYYAYIYSNDLKTIYIKTNKNSFISNPFPVVSLNIFLNSPNNDAYNSLYLSNPVLVYNPLNDHIGIIFWCGNSNVGKLFYSYVDKAVGGSNSSYNRWSLVAGSYSSSTDASVNAVNSLFSSSDLLISSGFVETTYIPEQKTAAYVNLSNDATANAIYVQYYINDTDIYERMIYSNGAPAPQHNKIN